MSKDWGEQCDCFLGACVLLEVWCCKMAVPRIRFMCQLELLISFETPVFVIIHGKKKKVSSHMNFWLAEL